MELSVVTFLCVNEVCSSAEVDAFDGEEAGEIETVVEIDAKGGETEVELEDGEDGGETISGMLAPSTSSRS